MLDGARNALMGYLYQLLGTAAVSVREIAESADAWAQLIAKVDEGELLSEEFGQDATLHSLTKPKHGVTAIQFKHSSVAGRLIERDELIDILIAFHRSRQEAALNGISIEQFTLITNRQLDPNVQEIVDYGINPTPHPSLTLLAVRGGRPVAVNVKRLIPYGGDPDRAAAEWHSIIGSLCVLTEITFDSDLHRLRTFAGRYGVLDREWESSLNSLVGAFVRETANGRTVHVTREWLKEQLIGDREAANLRFGSTFAPHITTRCRDLLDQRTAVQHRIRPEHYLERSIQQELQTQLDQYPVVFVAGGGGRGKSLAVANYLRSVVDSQLVWSIGAESASESAIVEALTRARLPRCPNGGIDRYLSDISARITTANGARRPLWTIDLDGVDESPSRFTQLSELINLCWAHGRTQASPASIVVTSRSGTGNYTREHLIGRWIRTPEPELVAGVGFFWLGDFVGNELADAARLLNGAPEQRIIRTISPDAPGTHPYSSPVPEEILRALCHPVVWGGYASLTEPQRGAILDVDRTNLGLLAEQLYRRFIRRCVVRRSWRDGLALERALPRIARENAGAPPYLPESWDRSCNSCLDWSESRDLYHEGLSYGIIDRADGRTWRWGHPFLADYLATLDGGDADE